MDNKSLSFLSKHKLGRLATASKEGMPHVTPVVYAIDRGNLVIAIDYGTKKLANLRENPKAALVVDTYRPNAGVMVQGECQIIERGPQYLRLLKILFERFDFYRRNPWSEGESPILMITPLKVVSWGV